MNVKSLVYSRSSPFELFPHTRQQLSTNCIKSLVYSRTEPSESSLLEGTSFEAQFRSISSKLQAVFLSTSLAALFFCVSISETQKKNWCD